MEIRIGVQNVPREIVIESTQDPSEVARLVTEALTEGSDLHLVDTRGSQIIVSQGALGYVEIDTLQTRRAGFGVGPL